MLFVLENETIKNVQKTTAIEKDISIPHTLNSFPSVSSITKEMKKPKQDDSSQTQNQFEFKGKITHKLRPVAHCK